MSILKILYYPDHRLRQIAHPVSIISNDTRKIVYDMFDTMYLNKGIGLAATQVNIQQQIIVIDLCETQQENMVLINPTIIQKTGIINHIKEGCLSIPEIQATIPRAHKIMVQSSDQYGNLFSIEATNLLSVCIQHEVDHLFGKLFIDYLSPLELRKIHKNNNKQSNPINTS